MTWKSPWRPERHVRFRKTQAELLTFLLERPGVSPVDIAEAFALNSTHVEARLNCLRASGWADRYYDDDDPVTIQHWVVTPLGERKLVEYADRWQLTVPVRQPNETR